MRSRVLAELEADPGDAILELSPKMTSRYLAQESMMAKGFARRRKQRRYSPEPRAMHPNSELPALPSQVADGAEKVTDEYGFGDSHDAAAMPLEDKRRLGAALLFQWQRYYGDKWVSAWPDIIDEMGDVYEHGLEGLKSAGLLETKRSGRMRLTPEGMQPDAIDDLLSPPSDTASPYWGDPPPDFDPLEAPTYRTQSYWPRSR